MVSEHSVHYYLNERKKKKKTFPHLDQRFSNLADQTDLGLLLLLLFFGFILWFFFFGGSGVWTQGLHLEPFHKPFFVLSVFEIGFLKLFAWVGFEPQSSWSLSAK
jgi:hypothetical protein